MAENDTNYSIIVISQDGWRETGLGAGGFSCNYNVSLFFFFFFKKGKQWGFPRSPEIKTSLYSVGGGGPHSIPYHETKILHALWPKKNNAKYHG